VIAAPSLALAASVYNRPASSLHANRHQKVEKRAMNNNIIHTTPEDKSSSIWVLDFEASGLDSKSYPIAVGVTNGDRHYSCLIKPMQHWDYWNWSSQAVHKIDRSRLCSEGKAATLVAEELNSLLENQRVYCDAERWDGFWLGVLMEDNDLKPMFRLRDISELFNSPEARNAYAEARKQLLKSPEFTQHDALDDARVIRQSLQAAGVIGAAL